MCVVLNDRPLNNTHIINETSMRKRLMKSVRFLNDVYNNRSISQYLKFCIKTNIVNVPSTGIHLNEYIILQ